MRLKHFIQTVFALAGIIVLASCSSDENNGSDAPATDTELTVSGISDTEWTYISLENNTVVGSSAKDDTEADAQWAKRTDWDIAICGDMLRTNSGTSGNGEGGIRRLDNKRYDDITASDAVSVDPDRPQTPDEPRQ